MLKPRLLALLAALIFLPVAWVVSQEQQPPKAPAAPADPVLAITPYFPSWTSTTALSFSTRPSTCNSNFPSTTAAAAGTSLPSTFNVFGALPFQPTTLKAGAKPAPEP